MANETLFGEVCQITIQDTLKDSVFELIKVQFPQNLIFLTPLIVIFLIGMFTKNLLEPTFLGIFFLTLIFITLSYIVFNVLLVM